jgi:hypothetical protein
MVEENPHAKAIHVLELAKAAINQQNPHLALEHLRSIEHAMEDLPETAIWAEHRLTLAEAYGALGNEAAPSFFEEALERLSKLFEDQPGLELRANEHYADFLYRFPPRRPSKAREHLVVAKRIATRIGKEDVARVQMKIVGNDLAIDKDAELDNFQTLKRVALQRHATHQKQLAGWMLHLEKQDRAVRGLRAARGKNRACEQYFAELFDSIRDLPE